MSKKNISLINKNGFVILENIIDQSIIDEIQSYA
jgi:hypothetical protein